jgi:hypothetical protein
LKYDQLLLAHFLRIYDISGLLVFEKKLDPDINLVQIPVDFKPGVYIIDLISGGMTISVQKLVIR